MSTQSPTPLTPKGPRNSRRNQKRTATPSTQNASTLATPPSSPPGAHSPKEAATDSSVNVPLSKKKNNRSAKKPRDVSRTSPVAGTGHRHTSSHTHNNITMTTPQLKDSPHYAGPTFHASPAPSALPIPSFISKSFPESDTAATLDPDSDSFDVELDIENTPSKPKSRSLVPQEERESTPLDFLFKAAVEARKCQPQRSPEPSPRVRSPQTDSKATRFTNGASGIFPLETNGSDPRHSPIGPSFAPSYKDRMNALRSASSPAPSLNDLDENERRAKTEALKNLLLNPRPQRPASISISALNQDSSNKERPVPSPMVPHYATPSRTSSVPPGVSCNGPSLDKNPPAGPDSHPLSPRSRFDSGQYSPFRNSTSGRDALSSQPGNMPSTPKQAYNPPFAAYDYPRSLIDRPNAGYYHQLHSKSPISRTVSASDNSPALDTKKMEDDLRRILKLDVNPSIPPVKRHSELTCIMP